MKANVETIGIKCPRCSHKRWVSLWWGWTQCKYCGRQHPSYDKKARITLALALAFTLTACAHTRYASDAEAFQAACWDEYSEREDVREICAVVTP